MTIVMHLYNIISEVIVGFSFDGVHLVFLSIPNSVVSKKFRITYLDKNVVESLKNHTGQ